MSGSIFRDCLSSNREALIELFGLSQSIIIYRCSPGDKAQAVKAVMENSDVFTLAIGDGANDVNMIQSASIGIGIRGKEGHQAANFSDFAISNFKSLRRLLFMHGRRYGTQFVYFLGIALYKGQLNMFVLFFNNLMNGFSGEQLYKEFYYSLFNVLHTTWTVLAYLFLDQDVPYDETFFSDEKLANTKSL